MKTLSFIFLITIAFFIRWLRWIAIVQQKEYRLDRLWLFLASPEGRQDFWRLLPKRKDFNRTGLKRPKRTARVAVVSVTSSLLLGCIAWVFVLLPIQGFWSWVVATILVGAVIYIVLPLLIIVSAVPSSLLSFLLTQHQLRSAQAKIHKSRPLIIGITGSYGKTSTKLLVSHVLSIKYQTFTTPKSYNTRYSVAKAINRNFNGEEIAILEYGAYTKGEIKFLAEWFPPQIAIITGLTLQHVGLFGDIASIIQAKSELVRAVPEEGAVFCNSADEGAHQICAKYRNRQHIAYSGDKSSVSLEKVCLNDRGQFCFSWKSKKIQTQLIGIHYRSAVEAAIAIGTHFGISDKEIITALESFEPTNNFVQLKTGGNTSLVIDDGGTANARGFSAALDLLSWYKSKGYKTVIITSGIIDLGRWADEVHQELATQALPVTDTLVYLGTEGKDIFSQVFNQEIITDKDDLTAFIKQVDPKTVVLIEGRVPSWVHQVLAV